MASSVMPITSLGLQHTASVERVSTGIPQLDTMLGGKGYYRGSYGAGLRHRRHRQIKHRGTFC
jgi:hypothetical protein